MKFKKLKTLVFGLVMIQLMVPTFGASEHPRFNFGKQSDVFAPSNPTSRELKTAAPSDLVVIPDPKLKNAIATQLGVEADSITVQDMSRLSSFKAESAEITDLTGLEYATSLTYLDLSSNQISDITPLSGLSSLKWLILDDNQISDITPISELTSLETLKIGLNKISDITPISELTSLETIALNNNKITDIAPLSKLILLDNLDLSNNQISDIASLSKLTQLTVVDLSDNQISDITPISELTSVSWLNLENNKINDIAPISELSLLSWLNLENNEISDIAPLSDLTLMHSLFLSNNQISDITPLLDIYNSGVLAYLYIENQNINLEDITINSDDEIFYEITNVDGSKLKVSLGSPAIGENTLSGSFEQNLLYGSFTGTINQNVTYIELKGLSEASSTEKKVLSNEELIALFDVESIDKKPIAVDQSAVDYDVPGEYPVVFTDGEDTLSTTLTVTDVLPTIDVTNNEVTIDLGDDPIDYIEAFGVSASEVIDGDLTTSITVDDSGVDYTKAGTYDVVFTVLDDESNSVSTTAKLIIKNTTEDELNGLAEASSTEKTELSNGELITLFEVESIDENIITVDQSAVDYDVPGEYPIVFADGEDTLSTTLTVTDVLPTIDVTNNEVTIDLGDDPIDYIEAFGVSASEVTDGDLTTSITVDDSGVDYTKAGTYDVVFTVLDDELNSVSTTAKLIIKNTTEDELNGLAEASSTEKTELSNEELITLFEVESIDENIITVDQSAVDYDVPGEYPVVFADGEDIFSTMLTVTDILPTIDVTNNEVTINLGDDPIDYIEAFGVSASEVTDGDLTTSITVDDSGVDYTKAGTYDVVFTVLDKELNSISKTVKLTINNQDSNDSGEIVIPDDKNDKPGTNNDGDKNYKPVSIKTDNLATTGSNIKLIALTLSAIVVVLLILRKVVNKRDKIS